MVVTGESFAELKNTGETERIAELERRIKLAVITLKDFVIVVHLALMCLHITNLKLFSRLDSLERGGI